LYYAGLHRCGTRQYSERFESKAAVPDSLGKEKTQPIINVLEGIAESMAAAICEGGTGNQTQQNPVGKGR